MTFACANCLREWDEPYCDECGRNLMRDFINQPSTSGGPGLNLAEVERPEPQEAG